MIKSISKKRKLTFAYNQFPSYQSVLTALICFHLTSCTSDLAGSEDVKAPVGREEARKSGFGNFFGTDFLLFGGPKKHTTVHGSLSPKVNGFLWQASLDTLSFLPLASADASGGIIVSEWQSIPNAPQERVKVTVYITSQQLRADALKVTIHKQLYTKGNWVTADTDLTAATQMENIILSKARQLRIQSLNR